MVAGWITIVDGVRGAIKKTMAQIKKMMAQQPAKKMSIMGAADTRAGSG